ncbi:MAG: helicase associated domain-containing protein, partial [Methylococcaceae bacterium]|nr:helicase associated domain-containing protein [Methylococcaceae bacterium]
GFNFLKQYVDEYGHAKVPDGLRYKDFNLGAWVSHQKTNKNKGSLNLERIKKLESLPSWVWRVKS